MAPAGSGTRPAGLSATVPAARSAGGIFAYAFQAHWRWRISYTGRSAWRLAIRLQGLRKHTRRAHVAAALQEARAACSIWEAGASVVSGRCVHRKKAKTPPCRPAPASDLLFPKPSVQKSGYQAPPSRPTLRLIHERTCSCPRRRSLACSGVRSRYFSGKHVRWKQPPPW